MEHVHGQRKQTPNLPEDISPGSRHGMMGKKRASIVKSHELEWLQTTNMAAIRIWILRTERQIRNKIKQRSHHLSTCPWQIRRKSGRGAQMLGIEGVFRQLCISTARSPGGGHPCDKVYLYIFLMLLRGSNEDDTVSRRLMLMSAAKGNQHRALPQAAFCCIAVLSFPVLHKRNRALGFASPSKKKSSFLSFVALKKRNEEFGDVAQSHPQSKEIGNFGACVFVSCAAKSNTRAWLQLRCNYKEGLHFRPGKERH